MVQLMNVLLLVFTLRNIKIERDENNLIKKEKERQQQDEEQAQEEGKQEEEDKQVDKQAFEDSSDDELKVERTLA